MKRTFKIKERILTRIDKENMFVYKKADILIKINIIFFALFLFVVMPVHSDAFFTKPMLFFGDLMIVIGMPLSILIVKSGKVTYAGMVTVLALMLLPLIHNTFGDLLTPSNASLSRYLETFILTCFLLPISTMFSINRSQLILAAILSIIDVTSHFYVIRFVAGVDIATSYLIYLVGNVILSMVGIINLNLAHEAIDVLNKSKEQITAWNKSLEQTIEIRTKELVESNCKLEAMSNTDGLTGIANRRKFDKHFASEWNQAERNGTPLAILLMDLDQFKLYNDTFGHQQGDQCLKLVAQSLADAFHRSGELVARYGGEEFVSVLPCVSANEAHRYGEHIRSNIEALAIQQAPKADHKVMTLSIGIVACTPSSADTQESFLKEADSALYSAKKLGRNRVELANVPEI